MQAVLDRLVTGPDRLAPGVTAYVSGPHGTWVGSTGVADLKSAEPMPVDARMRIESASKTWLLGAVLQLVQEGKLSLEDTVDQWLPGLLRAHGSEITLRRLVSDSSGLIDDNDVFAPGASRAYLARVRDPNCGRAGGGRGPATSEPGSPGLAALVHPARRLAAPCRSAWHRLPPLQHRLEHRRTDRRQGLRHTAPTLYRERIFQPLRLGHTAYDPQGPIAGAHAHGYELAANGTLTDTTARHFGKGADGAIVTDATDEATFLTALTNGTLLQSALDQSGQATLAAAAAPSSIPPAAPATASNQTSSTPPTAAASPSSSSTAERPATRVRAPRGRGSRPLLRRLIAPHRLTQPTDRRLAERPIV